MIRHKFITYWSTGSKGPWPLAREGGRGGRRAPSPVYAYRGGRPGFGFRPERPSSRCRQPCSPVWTQSAPRALCPRPQCAPAGARAGRGGGVSLRAAVPPRRAASARCPPRPRARPSPRPRDTRGDSSRSPSARRQARPAGPPCSSSAPTRRAGLLFVSSTTWPGQAHHLAATGSPGRFTVRTPYSSRYPSSRGSIASSMTSARLPPAA